MCQEYVRGKINERAAAKLCDKMLEPQFPAPVPVWEKSSEHVSLPIEVHAW